MDSLFGDDWALPAPPAPRPPARSLSDRSFPARVAALLRSRPIGDLATAAARQEWWPEDGYDVPGLALAAIELVIAQQGFEDEATYPEVVDGLVALTRSAAPGRGADDYGRVARYVLDGLLNRSQQEAPFTFRISDWSGDSGHQHRQVQFRLLVEREDPVRGEVVLNATGDAINALVGGLEFEVEDEQVANEILLERQLARGAFDAAERAAARARLLSVGLADRLHSLLRETRRDLRSVLDDWADRVPAFLDAAREHVRGRIDVEHRLLVKVRETVVSDDPVVAQASARIAALLEESRRRHESLHARVIEARTVFLDEQDRQSFRPPATGYLPDLRAEVLLPLLGAPAGTALAVGGRWLSDLAGPRAPRLPRLYRLVNDLWSLREEESGEVLAEPSPDELGGHDEPLLRDVAVQAAARAVGATGLPARLSALIAACLADPATPSDADRQQAAEITALAALWCFSPEQAADNDVRRADVAARVLGPRAAADADELLLRLPGWAGDDLVVAPFADALADADPPPVTELHAGAA
jgi:hypothetical protein